MQPVVESLNMKLVSCTLSFKALLQVPCFLWHFPKPLDLYRVSIWPIDRKRWGRKWWGGPVHSSGLSSIRCNLSYRKHWQRETFSCCFLCRYLERIFLILLMWKKLNWLCSRLLFAPMVTSFSLPLNCTRQQQLLPDRALLTHAWGGGWKYSHGQQRRRRHHPRSDPTAELSVMVKPAAAAAFAVSDWNCLWHERLRDRWGINLHSCRFSPFDCSRRKVSTGCGFFPHLTYGTPFNDSAQKMSV